MKLHFPLLLAGVLCAASAQAQIGVKAGVNAAILNGQDISQDTKFTTSYHAGAFYVIHLVGPVSVRPEVLYSVQGSNFKSAKEDFTTNLSYLNLPLLADVKISRLHLQAGPQFGVMLQAKQSGTASTGYNATTGAEEFGNVSRQITSQYKRGDFSICAGAEFELLAGLRIGGRFTAGLNDIANYREVKGVNDAQLKNRVAQVYLAFQLGDEND